MSFEQKDQQSSQQSDNKQEQEQKPSHMNQGSPGFRPNKEMENNPSGQRNEQDERSRKAS
jgi:hypothetical protein